jgi:hypothetical protein
MLVAAVDVFIEAINNNKCTERGTPEITQELVKNMQSNPIFSLDGECLKGDHFARIFEKMILECEVRIQNPVTAGKIRGKYFWASTFDYTIFVHKASHQWRPANSNAESLYIKFSFMPCSAGLVSGPCLF